MKIQIHPEIYQFAPEFVRGIVVATDMSNDSQDPELAKLLTEAVHSRIGNDPGSLETILRWDEIHRCFGSNPNRYPPAHKNLLKRVRKPGCRLPYINSAVAIMNKISLELATPVGGDDIDRASTFGEILELRLAVGIESFLPLGKDAKPESPEPKEVVYAVGNTVACRRFNWRNSAETLISPKTSTLVMNVDGVGSNAHDLAVEGVSRVADQLARFTGAKISTSILDTDHNSYQIN